MADQTLKGNIPLTEVLEESAEPQPALQSSNIGLAPAAQKVLDIVGKTLEPHEGPEAVEGLSSLTQGTVRATVHSAAKDAGVASVEALLLGQTRPIKVDLTTPGMLEGQELQSVTVMGPIQDLAMGFIGDKLKALGIKGYESASLADREIAALMIAPPLSQEATNDLRDTANLVAQRVRANLEKAGLNDNDSAVSRAVRERGLVINDELSRAA